MDEPRDITFRGKPATIYTWRRGDRGWQSAGASGVAAETFFAWDEVAILWGRDHICLVFDVGQPSLNAMRYW